MPSYFHIIGKTIKSNKAIDDLIPKEDIQKIKLIDSALDFSTKGTEAFLAIEAKRFELASLFDPFLAMHTSKIDPLPFQIEAVYNYVLKLPRIRFLIADDPGAGKTIMAGLIIKELKLRGIAQRILIIVPGHLKNQWLRELKEKFQEHFRVIDRNIINNYYGENPWQKENQIITSMDFAKQEDILRSLSSTFWDLVIVDEAHKMAAYKYGDKLNKTDRYKLGEVISRNSEHLLFLTATPHKGDSESFRLFLDLLAPGFFATPDLIKESIKNKDNPLFIRRLKEDLRDFEGKPLFTNRYPKTIKFRLSNEEKILYNELSQYVISQYNKALNLNKRLNKKRNVAFALTILQRRMASSTYALLKSLERRKKKLEDLLNTTQQTKYINNQNIEEIDLEELEDYEEKYIWEEEKKWESISFAQTKQELEEEISILNNLIIKAAKIVEKEEEIKLKELKKAIDEGFRKIEEIGGNKKILIFTESKDTLDHLIEKIKSWGYSVNFIHGAMDLEERIKEENRFKQETQIMVATEAAGEGINLQFCHLMINYDIPWNPTKLEQRIGRIHRYGQQKDVYIFNLIAEDTREGKVLTKILEKLEEIRNSIGSDKVFDVIGEIFQDINLYQLILDAVTNAKNMDEIIQQLDIKIDEDYLQKIKDALGESLATKNIDYTKIKEISQKAQECRLIPEYLEEFFKKAFSIAGGKYEIKSKNFISITSVPYEIRKIAEQYDFKNKYGTISKNYPKVTFDKNIAFKNPNVEFISFGHPLLEALIEWIISNYFHKLKKGAVFEDPSGNYNGIIWFFEGEVKDGEEKIAGKRILAIYDNGKELKEINPSILWDFIPVDQKKEEINLNFSKERAYNYAIDIIKKYKEEILKERERQAKIKEKYGIKSLEYLQNELDEELIKLEEEKEKQPSEKIEKEIELKYERKRNYEKALKELKENIEREKTLIFSNPEFLGAIFVKPTEDFRTHSKEMVSNEEIEKIGMKIAMEYEISQGRHPEDVSTENLGFDIRSTGKQEIRYIEVKARNEEGEIALTPNEWLKAKRFKEQYWLYIVANASTNPTLYIINNPAENLKVKEKMEIVRFIVPLQEWKNKGEKVS